MKLKSIHGAILVSALLIAALAFPALIIPVGICIAAVACVALAVADGHVYLRRSGHTHAINTLPANVGSSKHNRRYLASGALALSYSVVKQGADDLHCAAVTATADKPLGVVVDEAEAAGDPVTVELLGLTDRTLPMVAGAAIAGLNTDVYMSAAGKVIPKPTAAGTYWRIGTNITAAGADGDPIEVATTKPRKLIVVAALTQTSNATITGLNSTAVNPTKADFDALLAEAGKLQHDFYVLAAALSGDADVTLATS